jgi:UDP-N-acetylmuramate dehydrogenase
MIMTEPTRFVAEGLRGELRTDVDMSCHVSWRAGGRVQRLYQPADLADLGVFLRSVPATEPLLAIGLGSNLLVRDGGLRGTVLLLHGALSELCLEGGLAYAQAGVPGAKLARFAALHNLQGAEFFAGIPGTVGGMLAMNAGCYGSETWEKVRRVQIMTRSGELIERTPDAYEVGYRHVALKNSVGHEVNTDAHALPEREFYTGAWFAFEPGDGDTSRAAIKALLAKRIASQPLHQPNAGSVFRNPPGDYAARLIEQCGLKGRQIGGAKVSEKHANFIVNVGGATATDIERLIHEVQAAVELKTGVRLHPEVKIVGERANHE